VLSNLINNAIKFTERSTITTITITAEKNEVRKEAVVTVSDTGSGISSDTVPRIFGRFATKSDMGIGLGLFISKRIIEAHGGKIIAYNNINGAGATFSFTLPLE
jgi:signal transduction histidine kinase